MVTIDEAMSRISSSIQTALPMMVSIKTTGLVMKSIERIFKQPKRRKRKRTKRRR